MKRFFTGLFATLSVLCIVAAVALKTDFDGWLIVLIGLFAGAWLFAGITWVIATPNKIKLYVTAFFKALGQTIAEWLDD